MAKVELLHPAKMAVMAGAMVLEVAGVSWPREVGFVAFGITSVVELWKKNGEMAMMNFLMAGHLGAHELPDHLAFGAMASVTVASLILGVRRVIEDMRTGRFHRGHIAMYAAMVITGLNVTRESWNMATSNCSMADRHAGFCD